MPRIARLVASPKLFVIAAALVLSAVPCGWPWASSRPGSPSSSRHPGPDAGVGRRWRERHADPGEPGWPPSAGEVRGSSPDELIERARRGGEAMPADVIERL